jgi:hypothetical protein
VVSDHSHTPKSCPSVGASGKSKATITQTPPNLYQP